MHAPNRREFQQRLLTSAIAYGLIESLWTEGLFAAPVKPVLNEWFGELYTLGQDLRGQKLKDTEFQAKMEALFRRVDLPELLTYLDLDGLARKRQLPDNGASSDGIDLTQVEGLPKNVQFGKQIFGMKKGRSIVPHGHSNMCTGFIVLHGVCHGRHYDRVEDHSDHYLIRPTIDATFAPGGVSTISDNQDNVHWFKAMSEKAFVFNVHVSGYDPGIDVRGRLYLDPEGEKVAGGLIKAAKMTSRESHLKYG